MGVKTFKSTITQGHTGEEGRERGNTGVRSGEEGRGREAELNRERRRDADPQRAGGARPCGVSGGSTGWGLHEGPCAPCTGIHRHPSSKGESRSRLPGQAEAKAPQTQALGAEVTVQRQKWVKWTSVS